MERNINACVGDLNNRWMLTFFARNILGARQEYFLEYDVFPEGLPMPASRTPWGRASTSGTAYS